MGTPTKQDLAVDVIVLRDGDQFTAQCLNFDVASFGPTPEAALAMVREAVELHIDGMTDAELAAARTLSHHTVRVDRA
ncbi:MAG: hypothetical protein NTX07_01995 [Solirubrobacterales bacterium]|nr:hypothetical protein [Solirubrobacterales bacterium]